VDSSVAMATITLRIVRPAHDDTYVAGSPVVCQGEAAVSADLTNQPLYFRWYSSLNRAVDVGRYSLNQAALRDPAVPYLPPALPFGSQVVALGASDREGETSADFEAMRHGAVAGGDGPAPCIIHVVQATVLAPALGAELAAASLVLKAQAPWAWGAASYHDVNRIVFRWSLEPSGGRAGRPAFASPNLGRELRFDPTDGSVTYEPRLADPAYTGKYTVTLAVAAVDAHGQDLRVDQASVNVVLQ